MDRRKRQIIEGLMAVSAAAPLPAAWFVTMPRAMGSAQGHRRAVPSSGESLPVIGLGSWLTFDAPPGDSRWRAGVAGVVQAFFAAGGGLLDSSPMYGYSQDAIGEALRRLGRPESLRSATKVWVPSASLGEAQIEHAQTLWGVDRFDLVQVHNLLEWEGHLDWLFRWRDEGRVRYVGVTTSHGRRHDELEEILLGQPIDFVQFTLNIADRKAEDRLLPLAGEHRKAVIINRPFRGGELFARVRGRALPGLAAELGCNSWAQFFLLYVVSHPLVTCAIPATSQVDHLQENMAVLHLPLPGVEQRREMVRAFESVL